MHTSGWAFPLFALPLNVLLAFIAARINPNRAARIIAALAAAGGLVFCADAFAAQIRDTLYADAPKWVFTAAALCLTAWICFSGHGGTARLTRVSGIAYFFTLFSAAAICLLSLRFIDLNNVLPVSPRDIKPLVLQGQYGGLIGLTFVFGRFAAEPYDRERLFRANLRGVLIVTALSCAVLLASLGVTGADFASRSDYPLFAAVKALSVPGLLGRVDAVAAAFTLIGDVCLLTLAALVMIRAFRPTR